MTDLVTTSSLIVVGILLTSATMGIVAASIMPGIDRWSKRFFQLVFYSVAFGIVCTVSELFFFQKPDFVWAQKAIWVIESVLESIPMISLTLYLLHYSGESWRQSRLFRVELVLWIVFLVLLAASPFMPSIYYLSDKNQLELGPFYPLLIAPLLIILALNLMGVRQRRNKLPARYYHAFHVFLVPLSAAMLVHTFFNNFLLLYTGLAISVVSMFAIVLMDQVEQYVSQQREIANQHASIMVLQMRPHFIYNTMTSIYYLCDQDSKKAQEVTLNFTTYLRKNFTAIASENTVPFTEELEHTCAYLAVEQAQFEDLLFVDYDTSHTKFRVPPLTLQPIVENSVKHGLDPDGEPLHIYIKTRETSSGSQIIVEDNGPGFEVVDDGDPHIALANIRQRLEMMCNGSLSVTTRDGGGAVVKVTIPKHHQARVSRHTLST